MSGVDMEEFTQQVRSGLDCAAARVYPSERFDELFRGRVRRRNRRRRTSIVAAAVMAGAAAAGIVMSVNQSGPARTSVQYATGPQSGNETAGAGWSWRPLPPAPLSPRIQDFSVWTGSQMIVWGGTGPASSVSSQGAAYDPTTNAWTKLPPAPIPGRVGPVGAWTGTEALIFGGVTPSGQSTDGAAYNPASKTWRTLPAAPLGNLTDSGSFTVWTGTQLLAWGFFGDSAASSESGCGSIGHGGGSCAIASFDPATNKWTVGATSPVEAPLFGDAFWTGAEMIVVGWSGGSSSGGGTGSDIAVAYNPKSDTWRELPATPLPGTRTNELAAWDGHELILGGGNSGTGEPVDNDAAACNPATNTWRRLPDAPEGFTGSPRYPEVWTGRYIVSLDDSDTQGRPIILDPGAGTWRLGPPASQPHISEMPAIWTGTEIIRWGGGTPYQTGQADSTRCCDYVTGGQVLTIGN